MTTTYLNIPFVPVPIPIQAPVHQPPLQPGQVPLPQAIN